MICKWCKTDAIEAAKRHDGPHTTWCPRHSIILKERADAAMLTLDAAEPIIAKLRADNARMKESLLRVRQGYCNIKELRKISGDRYGALTREEIEGVIQEIDKALEVSK